MNIKLEIDTAYQADLIMRLLTDLNELEDVVIEDMESEGLQAFVNERLSVYKKTGEFDSQKLIKIADGGK